MNSTPESPDSIMRFTAFPPAPPTPITLIVAPDRPTPSSTSSNMSSPPLAPVLDQILDPAAKTERKSPQPPLTRHVRLGVVPERMLRESHAGGVARVRDRIEH